MPRLQPWHQSNIYRPGKPDQDREAMDNIIGQTPSTQTGPAQAAVMLVEGDQTLWHRANEILTNAEKEMNP